MHQIFLYNSLIGNNFLKATSKLRQQSVCSSTTSNLEKPEEETRRESESLENVYIGVLISSLLNIKHPLVLMNSSHLSHAGFTVPQNQTTFLHRAACSVLRQRLV